MIIVDAHQDLAYNHSRFGRDYLRWAYHKRRAEVGSPLLDTSGYATLGLPDALLGRVAVAFATLYVAPWQTKDHTLDYGVFYDSPPQAHQLANKQLEYYYRLCEATDRVRLIRTAHDLQAVLDTWKPDVPLNRRVQGLILLMENAEPIRSPKQYEEWYERGLYMVGFAWTNTLTRYAGGNATGEGLTRHGRDLLEVMASFNAMLDVSHLSDLATHEALEAFDGHIIASHSNPRKFMDSDRNLSDVLIRLIAERDGVIGLVMFNLFIDRNWGLSNRRPTLLTVVDMIDYVCQLTGSERHVGIGSDLDGGFGAESTPIGLDTVTDLWRIGELLQTRGYTVPQIEAILGGNFLRKLNAVLPNR